MTYADGSSFEGVFNGERIKDGPGKYTWMKPAEEDGEDPQVCALLQSSCVLCCSRRATFSVICVLLYVCGSLADGRCVVRSGK